MVSGKVKAVFGVAGVVFLSKILGLGREVVIADKFGTTADYDLFLIALILPAFVYGVLNFACFYLFVPYLSRRVDRNTDQSGTAGWREVWPTVNLTMLAALALTVAIIVVSPYLMKIWAGYADTEGFARVVMYSRITAALVMLGVLEAFMRAFLNAKGIYTYPASGYIVYNIVAISAILSALLLLAWSVGCSFRIYTWRYVSQVFTP